MPEGWMVQPGSSPVAAVPSAACRGGGGCSCPSTCAPPPCWRSLPSLASVSREERVEMGASLA